MIYLIGGAPMLGKTTIARKLSFKYQIPLVECDDICSIAGKADPSLSVFQGSPYYQYFTDKSIEEISKNALIYQEKMEKIIESFIHEKAQSGDIIVEGMCILPHMFRMSDNEEVKRVFIVGSDALMESQYRRLHGFGTKSTDKKLFDEHFVQWLQWNNELVRCECEKWNKTYIYVNSIADVMDDAFDLAERALM